MWQFYFSIGRVPSSLCSYATLTGIHISDAGSNPLVTCLPLCLTTITIQDVPSSRCPSPEIDTALCGFIAATNIQSITGYTMWSCASDSVTSSNPCEATVWAGVSCISSSIYTLALSNVGLTGMSCFNEYSSMYCLNILPNIFQQLYSVCAFIIMSW